MNIYSENFLLRSPEASDQEYLRTMLNDPQIENSVGGWSFPISEKTQNDWFKNFENSLESLKLVIENKDGEFVGLIGASDIDMKNGTTEVHIKLFDSNLKCKGIGTEVMSIFANYCFQQLRLHCLYAIVLEENLASLKMFKKCGFLQEGILKERIYKNGEYKNVIILSKIS